ncbi:uncharacterized protein BP5553_08182 [Venustampulla echinocandica]|uniref:Uncharacterized protein n=1 Tax=Venustampulla echinocandica TaxID=2656787 RepID=A0A370TFY8_9HELO|nr:uncharacterized protein BP5553_08182 [Venustampulla echinocandica]RDL33814.1 hypothetical protein BP5553_08182 [Venustampulla echinocandica]
MSRIMALFLMVLQVLLGHFTIATAVPTNDMAIPMTADGGYPELILGPGMPTLASINLTTADLYTMKPKGSPGHLDLLQVRADAGVSSAAWGPSCGIYNLCPVWAVQVFINYFYAFAPHVYCTASTRDYRGQLMVQNGYGEVMGINLSTDSDVVYSPCHNVANALERIFATCKLDPDFQRHPEGIYGAITATGNGGLGLLMHGMDV